MTYLHKIQSSFSLIFFFLPPYLPILGPPWQNMLMCWSLKSSVSLATASTPNDSLQDCFFPLTLLILYLSLGVSVLQILLLCTWFSNLYLWPSPCSQTPDTPDLCALLAYQIQRLQDIIPTSVKSLPSSPHLGDKNKITLLTHSTHGRNPEVKRLFYFLCSSQYDYCQVLENSTPSRVSLPPLTLPLAFLQSSFSAQVLSTLYLEKKQKSNWFPHFPSILPVAAKSSIPMPGLQSISLCSKAFRRSMPQSGQDPSALTSTTLWNSNSKTYFIFTTSLHSLYTWFC